MEFKKWLNSILCVPLRYTHNFEEQFITAYNYPTNDTTIQDIPYWKVYFQTYQTRTLIL